MLDFSERKVTVLSMPFTLVCIFLCFNLLGQPPNDICTNLTAIGNLPNPGACIGGLQDGAPVTINGTTINANPEFPYPYVSGGCQGSATGTSFPGNDVWYSFVSTGTTINFNLSGLPNANLVVYQGGVCGAFTYVRGCLKADNLGNGALTITPIQQGVTYFVQVSSDDTTGTTDGPFTLDIDNDVDCDNCYRNGNITATPAPTNGKYNPGQVVTFCYEVTHWEQMNANWFHGIQIAMGAGWTGAVSNPVPAATCQVIPGPNSGTWDFYPTGIGIVNGVNWGTGFYFTDPFSLSPDFGYGDDCSGAGSTWTFCWDLTVDTICDPNSDLSVTINTSGDGESGGWWSVACIFDDSTIFNATGIDAPTANANSNSPLCMGHTILLEADTVTGATYLWITPSGDSIHTQNPSIPNSNTLDSGRYILEVTLNGCTGYDTVNVAYNGNALLNPSSNSPICEGDTIKLFSDTITAGIYNWTGPNGFNSNMQSPEILIANNIHTGRYYVDVTSGICNNSDSIDIVINPTPTANVNADTTICENDTLNLTANFVAGATYLWTGPNGFNSAIQNPTINGVALANAGNYFLEITLNGCTAYDTTTIIINPIPNAIANSNSPLCVNDTIDLTANMIPGAAYSWSGPNGFNSILQNPSINTIALNNAGDYYLEISLNGCIGYDTTSIIINDIPIASASANSPLCEGDTINLNASFVAGANYLWTGPNGFNSNLQNPSINTVNVLNSGDYYLEVTLNGCTGYDTISITINPIPLANANSNSPLCEGDTINLNTNFIPGATYSWTGPNGFSSVIQNPSINTVNVLNAGDYYLEITLNGCTGYDTTTVIINAISNAIAGSNSSLCEGDSLGLIANNVIGANYSWTGPNGFNSNLQNPTIDPVSTLNAGDYYLEISLNGCVSYDTTTVIISASPTANGNGNSPLCGGDTINLSANFVPGATYSWSGPNGFTSVLQNPSINSVSTLDSGEYIVNIVLGSCSASDTINIIVNPQPIAIANANSTLCDGDTLNLTSNTIPGANYSWTGPNLFTSALQNPTINTVNLTQSGDYYLEISLGSCIAYDTINVLINPKPIANASANSPLCVGDTLNLGGNFIGGASYSWIGPNGFTSNARDTLIDSVTTLFSGDYILSISYGNCFANDTINVIVNPTPIAIANGNSPICDGDTISLTANTSTGGNYSWTGPNGFSSNFQNPTIQNVTKLDSGDYYLEISLGSCVGYDTISITVNSTPNARGYANSPLCVGDTLLLNADTIIGANYRWIDPNGFFVNIQNPTLYNILTTNSGNYILEVELNGCYDYDTINILINPVPIANASGNSPLCEGDNINLTANTIPGARYSWIGPNAFNSLLQNPVVNGATITNSGDYYLDITLNGCTNYDTTNIIVNPYPVSVASINSPLCDGDSIFLNATFAAGATYSWTGPNGFSSSLQNDTLANVTSIDSGDYYLEVTLNGCTSYDTVHTSIFPIPTTLANGNTPLCEGDILNLTTSAFPNANYSWTGPNAFNSNLQNPTINSIPLAGSGNYYLEVNANGCINYDTVNILVNSYPTATAFVNSPLCEGFPLSVIANTVPGGANYQWSATSGFSSNAQSTSIPNSSMNDSGFYYLEVTKNGCTSYDTTYLIVRPLPVANITSNTNICSGDTIWLFADTVTTATYSWTGPNGFNSTVQNPVINTVNPIHSGDYYLEVTLNGCTSYDTITILVNSYPGTSTSINSPLCDGDTIYLTAANVLGATYSWTGPNGFNSNLQNPQNPNISTLDSGDYYLEVTLNGCTSYDTVNVSVYPIPPAIANGNTPICEGDTIRLMASLVPGATYSWTGPNGFNSNIQNPTINTVPLIYSGDYYLEVTLDGCTGYDTVSIDVNPFPNALANANSPLCDGDNINLSANGIVGSIYSWSGPNGFTANVQNPTINGATTVDSGEYYLEVTLNGCTSYDTTRTAIFPIPLAIAAGNNSLCENDTLNLTANFLIGANYRWTGPNGFNSNLQNPSINGITSTEAGNYYLEVEVNGCIGYDTINVTVIGLPIINVSANSPLCIGGTLNLSANPIPGALYNWSGPLGFNSTIYNPFINFVTFPNSGDYYIEVTANGCTNYDTINITVDTNFSITGSGAGSYCEEDTLFLNSTAVPGATYSWTGPNGFTSSIQNPQINNLQVIHSGNYIVTVSGNGCLDRDTLSVMINPIPISGANTNAPLCIGDTLFLYSNTVIGANYSWTGPNGFTSNIQNPFIANTVQPMSGNYYLEVTLNGCTGYDTLTVIIDPPVSATINPAGPFCINSSIQTITAINPGGMWSGNGIVNNSTGTFDPSIAGIGTHTVTYISTGGCPDTQTINIIVYNVQTPIVNITPTSGCSPLLVDFSHNIVGATDCEWYIDNNFITDNCNGTTHTLTDAGCYDLRLELTDANGCTISATFDDTICVHPTPIANFDFTNEKITILNNSANFINNSINNDNNLWIFSGIDSSNFVDANYQFPDIPGTYEVCLEVESALGCRDTLCKNITIHDVPYLYVPSAFSPNADGHNETFKPIISLTSFEDYEFMIFNRWGDLIFETKDIHKGWDGTHNKEKATDDVYVWRIKLKQASEIEIKSFIGHFTLLR